MKNRGNQILFAVFLGAILPMLIFSYFGGRQKRKNEQATQPTQSDVMQIPTTGQTVRPTQPPQPQERITVAVLMKDGSVEEMLLNDYLTNVVLREMPADFESEALKAQAVVARTYTLHKTTAPKHGQAVVCTDPGCCQGFCSQEEYLRNGGTEQDIKKVQQAVLQTDELVITYDGRLIEATYFSCSGGKTEDALAVWGTDVPYLQSTESPGEEGTAFYTDTVKFTAAEFNRLLGGHLTGPAETWLEEVTYTKGGGVSTMTLCGKTFQGTDLRQMLGLRSTAFMLTAIGDSVTITTKGYGHRVGMSQYGADAMAVAGSNFVQILAHYYKGTVLEVYAR